MIVGSAHAVTEDGQIVVASASGSQLSAYAAGASEVFLIIIIGAQKIVSDLDTAFRRVETYSLPLESRRLQEIAGRPSVIGKLLILRKEIFPGRTTVVISREAIGF